MDTVKIGDGLTIPRVVTGLWQVSDGVAAPDAAVEAMKQYVDAGLYAFDVADHYGPAEEIIGAYRSSPNAKEIVAFTKWCPSIGVAGKDACTKAVDKACARMKTDSIDLLQYHPWRYDDPSYLRGCMNSVMVHGTQRPGLAKSKFTPLRNGAPDDANTSENLWHLSKLQADGRIKNLGVTNVDLAHLRMLHSSGYRLATNQVSMSVLDRRAQVGGLAQWCSENGVALLAYGTLLGGFLSEKWRGKPEPSAQQLNSASLQKYKRFIDAAGGWEPFQMLLKAVADVAAKHGVSIGAVATRYVLQQPAVAAVIVGSRLDADAAAEYIKSDIAACSSAQDGRGFKLDDSDLAAIERAQEGLKPVPNDCGDEYRWPPFLTATGDLSAHLNTAAEDKQLAEVERVIAAGGRVQRSSGSPWEPVAGYCRGVRIGSTFVIAGTTTRAHPSGEGWIGGSSYADQATYCFDLVTGAVRALGGSLGDVMRTRAILTSLDDYQGVMRAHGRAFRPHGTRPGYTMIGNNTLVGDGILVEIEVDGVIRGAGRDAPLLMI